MRLWVFLHSVFLFFEDVLKETQDGLANEEGLFSPTIRVKVPWTLLATGQFRTL
jgi:hypothetical protein